MAKNGLKVIIIPDGVINWWLAPPISMILVQAELK